MIIRNIINVIITIKFIVIIDICTICIIIIFGKHLTNDTLCKTIRKIYVRILIIKVSKLLDSQWSICSSVLLEINNFLLNGIGVLEGFVTILSYYRTTVEFKSFTVSIFT